MGGVLINRYAIFEHEYCTFESLDLKFIIKKLVKEKH
jgi:hypothetical protein